MYVYEYYKTMRLFRVSGKVNGYIIASCPEDVMRRLYNKGIDYHGVEIVAIDDDMLIE